MTLDLKRCSKCRLNLPIDKFNADKQKSTGLSSRCRECRSKDRFTTPESAAFHREYSKSWYETNGEHIRQNRRTKYQRDGNIQYQKHKVKFIARSYVRKAVLSGYITRDPCEICGSLTTEGHHWKGYDKENYLNVRWLCKEHHMKEHRVYG